MSDVLNKIGDDTGVVAEDPINCLHNKVKTEDGNKESAQEPDDGASTARKQIKILKLEYTKIVAELQDECKENAKKQEIIDEYNNLILPFISNLEKSYYKSNEVSDCMMAMIAVVSERFDGEDDEEVIPSNSEEPENIDAYKEQTQEMLISIFKSMLITDVTCAFSKAQQLWRDDLIEKANEVDWKVRIIDEARKTGGDILPTEEFDEHISSDSDDFNSTLGCSKSGARKLEELMGTEYPEFDEFLGRKEDENKGREDRTMRNTLKKYIGKRIEFKGIIEGRPIKHEKTGRVFDNTINDYPKYRDNVIITGSEPFDGPVSPIEFPEDATCIKNIIGINGFEDILEDHVNLQEDIITLWSLKKGDEVFLSAVVAEYQKRDGTDCCLIDVERLHR